MGDCIEDSYCQLEEATIKWKSGLIDRRQEEAERFNKLLRQHLPLAVKDWTCDEDGWRFEYQDAIVTIDNNELGVLSIRASSETMPRRLLDGMRGQLRHLLQSMSAIEWNPTGFVVGLLQICEEAAAWERMWQQEVCEKEPIGTPGRRRRLGLTHGWNAAQAQTWNSIMDNPFGVNLSTIEDAAIHLLGESISDVCSRIPETLRILHVEPVFREDLATRFLKRKERMHRRLFNKPYRALRQSVSRKVITFGSREDTNEGLINELIKPSVTFHGAPRRVIESIIRYGFIIPGSKIGDNEEELDIRCGSSYGVGVYSSPDPMYASYYLDYDHGTSTTITRPSDVPGMRLIVCATLMGMPMLRQWHEARDTKGLMSDQGHSHFSPNRMEYIVYDSAQIIPVYVLHLDYGAEAAKEEFDRISKAPQLYFQKRQQAKAVNKWDCGPEICPGDIQRRKQALKNAASKWFPYGYGPATGTSFVIEEIADVSDDEETFGDFQHQRIEQETEIQDYVLAEGMSWFDEYQTVRKTTHGVKQIS